MSLASTAVTGLLALGMAWCAYAEFTRWGEIPSVMAKAHVPGTWLPWLATAKLVALAGLVVGFWVPVVGTATAAAVILYFLAALVQHASAHDTNIWGAMSFLILACATLGLRIAFSDALGVGILA